jgi:hypothetical protein
VRVCCAQLHSAGLTCSVTVDSCVVPDLRGDTLLSDSAHPHLTPGDRRNARNLQRETESDSNVLERAKLFTCVTDTLRRVKAQAGLAMTTTSC